MSAVFSGLEAEAYDREYSDRELVRRIGHYFRPYRLKLIMVVIAMFLMAGAGTALPLVVGSGVGIMVDSRDASLLPWLIAIIFIVGVGNWLANGVRRKLTAEMLEGETIALVGHTGAGKSSIIKLIARFYEFQGGELRFDGRDIRTLDLTDYRRELGIVSQIPFLFDGSIADNVRFGCPEASDEAILDCARRIGEGGWLETLPDGIYSQVGERGSRLSMGQRQLVALARVLLQQPSIFLFDEATASVDPFTESQIQEALELIMQKTTAIIIAHRLSTVRAADRIIVLERGQIVEQGSHVGLMAQGGQYADLYNTYFRHQSPEYISEVGARYKIRGSAAPRHGPS